MSTPSITRQKYISLTLVTAGSNVPIHVVDNESDDVGAPLILQTKACDWDKLHVRAVALQVISKNSSTRLLIRGLRPLDAPKATDLLQIDPNCSPSDWRDGRRYSSASEPWRELTGELVLEHGRQACLDIALKGRGRAYVGVSLICEPMDDMPVSNGATEVWMQRVEMARELYPEPFDDVPSDESAGAVKLTSLTKQPGGLGFSLKAGTGVVGGFINLSTSVEDHSVLRGVFFQKDNVPTGCVVVMRDLQVWRNGVPRTPNLFVTDEIEFVNDYERIHETPTLRCCPIVGPGDIVRLKAGASGSAGEHVSGVLSVIVKGDVSQIDINRWIDLTDQLDNKLC